MRKKCIRIVQRITHNAMVFVRLLITSVFLHPLALMLVAVSAASITLLSLHKEDESAWDGYILSFIAFCFMSSAFFMVAHTRWHKWTILGAGLLATFLADALIYSVSGYGGIRGESFIYSREFIFGARILFVIGGIWTMIGLVQEAWYETNNTRIMKAQKIIEQEKGKTDGSDS